MMMPSNDDAKQILLSQGDSRRESLQELVLYSSKAREEPPPRYSSMAAVAQSRYIGVQAGYSSQLRQHGLSF
jgi:hypothetical protein